MSRLGKSLKNRFLAMALAGAMVITSVASSGMPVFAEESSDVEVAADAESQHETKDVSEEAAEEEEVKRKDSEETETEEKNDETTETTAKNETTAVSKAANDEEIREDGESDTASEDAEESQTDADNKDVIYTSDSAALVDGHTYATWGLNETALIDDGTPMTADAFQGTNGIYKNEAGDILYIDTKYSGASGKFAPASGQARVNKTKIYIPVKVENNQAKIILYQKSISVQDQVIYQDGMTDNSFALSGTDFSSAQCSAFVKSGNDYKTELTCTLTGNKASSIICIEIKGTSDNYISKIISGKEVRDDIYDSDYGNSKDLVKYNMEGYANAYGVTGGGMLKETTSSYYKVSNAVGFLEALTEIKKAAVPSVIEVTGDLNLGSKEIGSDNLTKYKNIIGANKFQALWHPTLKTSGVSDLTLEGFNDLTIFSSNEKGAAIKHCNIIVKKSTNIIFRNFTFDELWEWDDGGTVEEEKATYVRGGYKRNDWDYLCIDSESDGIWIDHCTFYKSYDGLIDIKNPKANGEERVTISWCKFEPKSAPDENGKHPFYDTQLETLEEDYAKGENAKAIYYRSLRTTETFSHTYTKYTNKVGAETTETFKGEGYSFDDIVIYTCGHKKAHLLGQDDDVENAVGIRVTFANNSWVNCMERLPRLRRGISHEYNCILDASELYAAKKAGSKAKSHLVSNGATSTKDGSIFLENCYIDGIDRPLLSGNANSPRGYIGFEGCEYIHDNDELKVTLNGPDANQGLGDYALTKAQFKEKLPSNYGTYQLYPAADLKTKVLPYAGAGSVKMTAVQWTKTSYGESGSGEDPDINPSTEEPETGESSTPESETDKGSSEAENPSETQESSSEETTGSEASSSEESSSEETSSVEASSEYEDTFSLRADEIKVDGVETAEFELESEHIQNGFTIKASSTSKVAVGSSSATVAGVKYTKRLRLSGDANKDKYSVHFTANDAGTLWVYAKNASSSGNKILALNKLEGNSALTKQRELLDKEVAAVRYDITEPGDYYIAPEVKGIDVYYIGFTTKKEIEPEYTKPSRPTGDIVYDAKEGADNTKTAYNMEGYAASANVTGGGLLKEESEHYFKVTNEKELLDALKATRSQKDTPNVIEITTDLNLGDLEMNKKYPEVNIQKKSDGDNTPYSGYIRAQMAEPIMHPVLKETGASYIKLHDFHNLTIFSTNGASIKHCGITIEGGTSNVIIRNLVFDELWEWDEATSGDYDRNDWDYMTIEDNATDIWVDHCTFYRSYDGILDMKNDSKYKGLQRVTVSWCKVLPGSEDPEFFDKQMNWLEENYANDTTTYYGKLRQTEGMTKEDIWWSAYGQKKAHLLGSGNGDIQDQAIRATFANNYYKNAQARLPRLRFGKTHVYNTVIDSAEMNAQHEKMKAAGKESHITGDGAISACYGEMLLENCYIDGARTPLRSGRGSTAGYINTDNCLYYMNDAPKELTISEYAPGTRKETDIVAFREKLPYTYNKYDPAALKERLQEFAGAGALEMTAVQWMRTNYNTEEGGGDEGSSSAEGSSNPESSAIEGSSNPESSSTEESGSASGVHIVITKPAENAVFYYTGAKITPDVEVRDYDRDKINGEILVQGVDYTVKYSNNAKADSEAVITIIGKGNYKGKAVTTTFRIKNADRLAEGVTPVEVKGAKIAIENQEYTGKAQYPNFTLTLKGGSPVEYTYNGDKGIYETVNEPKTPIPAYVAVSNNVNKGTATLLLTGASDGKKPTTVKKTFKITPVDLSKVNADDFVITTSADAEYAVKGAVPETLSVVYKGMPLKLGKDYTVKYGNNKKAGQSGTITITGKGNYAKKYGQQKTYDIKKLDLSQGDRLKAVAAYEKIKKKAVKATVVDRNGTVIKPSEYDITIYKNVKTEGEKKIGVDAYEENEELQTGTIYVQVTAKTGDKINLQNSTEPIEFAVGVNIAKAKVTDKKTGKTAITQDYKGVPIELQESDLVVTMKGEADPLKPGTDYEIVSYENNVNKGTATAVIKGKGKYSGTKTVKFKIVQREMVKGEKIAQNTINVLKNYMNRFSN